MIRGLRFLAPVLAGAVLLAGPALAQVQSQPLPPPAGTPSAPPAAQTPPATPPSTTPSVTKTEPARTPATKPAAKPAPKTAQGKKTATCPSEKVDINAASADTLRTLPDIGVRRGGAIIKARPYATPEDLVRKKVLKKAVYEKIKSCIVASGVAPSATPAAPSKRQSSKSSPTAAKSRTAAAPVPIPMPADSSPKPQQ